MVIIEEIKNVRKLNISFCLFTSEDRLFPFLPGLSTSVLFNKKMYFYNVQRLHKRNIR